MSLFRVVTRLAVRTDADAYKWSYVWYVDAASVGDAADYGAEEIWPALAQAHLSVAFCYEVYASDLVPETTNYTVVSPIIANQPGEITASSQLYNPSIVVRVELNVAGSRPSRKYHRMPLQESDVTNGIILESGATTAVSNAYSDVLGLTSLRDESGNLFSGYTVRGITTRRLGKLSRNDVPPTPS